MTDEKLIEEAASAIHSVAESGASWLDARMADKAQHRAEARAAFAVFEKAHTPTDDERELSERLVARHLPLSAPSDTAANIVRHLLEVGLLRRSEVSEPRDRDPRQRAEYLAASKADAAMADWRPPPEPQGEPSDCAATPADWLDHAECYPCKLPKGHSGDHETDTMTWAEPQGEPSEVEFPFTHDGVKIEQDDGGLWITVNPHEPPRWLGPKALAALRAAGFGGTR